MYDIPDTSLFVKLKDIEVPTKGPNVPHTFDQNEV